MGLEAAVQTSRLEPPGKENPQPLRGALCRESSLDDLGLSKRDCARVCLVFTWFCWSSTANDDFLLRLTMKFD